MVPIKLFSKVVQAFLGLFFLRMCLPGNFIFGQSYILIDSSGNGYTLFMQDRECIAYNRVADGIVIVNRAYLATGALNVHSVPGNLSTIYRYPLVYNQQLGPARYPAVYAGTIAPYITFPYLVAGSPGGIGGQYESGGWFSGFWGSPVDIGPGDIDAIRSYLNRLPTGNMHFLIRTTTGQWLYRIYPPDLANQIGSGVYPYNGWSFWGSDSYDGLFCIGFYKFIEPESVYKVIIHHTTVDTWDLAIPSPYGPSIEYTQLALTANGQPLLVFNWRDLTDSTYPYRSKIYVSHTSGVPPIELTSVFPDSIRKCIYPTIATGANKAVVIFNKPRNNLTDSLCWMDIYKCYSTDNGYTWSLPENITQWSSWRIGLQQLAKRIDTSRNRFYYIFARNKVIDHDPLWHLMYGLGTNQFYIYLGYASVTGVIEANNNKIKPNTIQLQVYPNPFSQKAEISYEILGNYFQPEVVSIKIYDATGRLVKQFNHSACQPFSKFIWDGTDDAGRELSRGVYFIRLNNQIGSLTQKIVIMR